MTKKKNNLKSFIRFFRMLSLEEKIAYVLFTGLFIYSLYKSNFVLAIVFFFLTLISVCILHHPIIKGKIGELKVSIKLKNIAKKYKGLVINNVIIPAESNKTAQLDHIVFLPSGIYVIETKNYAGRVYGNDIDKEWTQVLNFGKTKNRIYSPVKQNITHIYCVKSILQTEHNINNIVCFTNNNTDYINSEFTYPLRKLKSVFKNEETILSDSDVKDCFTKINEFKIHAISTNKEHVANIKNTQKKIKENICPRCGGELVLRTNRDGKQFYGCSNYPKCTFTKKFNEISV